MSMRMRMIHISITEKCRASGNRQSAGDALDGLVFGRGPEVDAQFTGLAGHAAAGSCAAAMEAAGCLRPGPREKRQNDGIEVEAAVAVSERAGELEPGRRRWIEGMGLGGRHGARHGQEPQLDAYAFGARTDLGQRASGLAVLERTFALLLEERTGGA